MSGLDCPECSAVLSPKATGCRRCGWVFEVKPSPAARQVAQRPERPSPFEGIIPAPPEVAARYLRELKAIVSRIGRPMPPVTESEAQVVAEPGPVYRGVDPDKAERYLAACAARKKGDAP